jgi:hypothetical protein
MEHTEQEEHYKKYKEIEQKEEIGVEDQQEDIVD